MGTPDLTQPQVQFQEVDHSQDLTPEEEAQFAALEARRAAQQDAANAPTEENFTHYFHLADGRVLPMRGSIGTVYTEGKPGAETFTAVVGVFPRNVTP